MKTREELEKEYSWADDNQIDEIERGIKEGLDISKYAKLEFNSYQLEEIKLGLEKGLDVSIYAKPELIGVKWNK